jgi:ribosomal protein S18 acetylase RimI-like enzyme
MEQLPTIEAAANAFIAGFTRRTLLRRVGMRADVGSLVRMRFSEVQGAALLLDEWLPVCRDPQEVVAQVRAQGTTPFHYISAIGPNPAELEVSYRTLGYRVSEREYLMVRPLAEVIPPPEHQVLRASASSELPLLNAVQESPVLVAAELAAPDLRQYYILRNGHPAAWGRAISVAGGMEYVGAVHTQPGYRRQGLARAVMLRMLADGAARGGRFSVLTSSEMGHELYRGLGFRDLAVLLVLIQA